MKTVRFHEQARVEFVSRVAYYEEIERGLGARFQAAVEKAVAHRGSDAVCGLAAQVWNAPRLSEEVSVWHRLQHSGRRNRDLRRRSFQVEAKLLAQPDQ